MKTVLVHLEISPLLDSVLETALLVGRSFGSYLHGLHVQPGQPDVIAAGADGFVAAAPDLVAGFEREARERAGRAREAFDSFMARHGLKAPDRSDPGPAGLSAEFQLELSNGQSAIGSLGRAYDLIVLGRPRKDALTPSMAALENALFESGRPLLIAPPQIPTRLGERIVIAWNGSSETARTIAMGRPFLQKAKKIIVLTVEKGVVPGPSARDVALNLRRHGFDVDILEVPGDHRSPGQAILEETAKLDADLLIKGAYTHSRLRQMIFGGATSHILAEAEIPVFMAN